MYDAMKSMCMVLTILIGIIGLTGSCKSVNQQPPMTRSPLGSGGQQNVPAPTFSNSPQLDMILINSRPILLLETRSVWLHPTP